MKLSSILHVTFFAANVCKILTKPKVVSIYPLRSPPPSYIMFHNRTECDAARVMQTPFHLHGEGRNHGSWLGRNRLKSLFVPFIWVHRSIIFMSLEVKKYVEKYRQVKFLLFFWKKNDWFLKGLMITKIHIKIVFIGTIFIGTNVGYFNIRFFVKKSP